MGEILLRAENIDKHFGITHALDNVSFTFNKGEIHALIGENGSGKSTLTSCLTGIYQKDSGKFILEGKEITATNQVEANHQGVAIHRTGDRNTFRTDCSREHFPWKRGSVHKTWYQKHRSNEQESPGISGQLRIQLY